MTKLEIRAGFGHVHSKYSEKLVLLVNIQNTSTNYWKQQTYINPMHEHFIRNSSLYSMRWFFLNWIIRVNLPKTKKKPPYFISNILTPPLLKGDRNPPSVFDNFSHYIYQKIRYR